MSAPDFQWNIFAILFAFKAVKHEILNIQPLTFFNKDGDITVHIDVFGVGISGVLCCNENPVLCTVKETLACEILTLLTS